MTVLICILHFVLVHKGWIEKCFFFLILMIFAFLDKSTSIKIKTILVA